MVVYCEQYIQCRTKKFTLIVTDLNVYSHLKWKSVIYWTSIILIKFKGWHLNSAWNNNCKMWGNVIDSGQKKYKQKSLFWTGLMVLQIKLRSYITGPFRVRTCHPTEVVSQFFFLTDSNMQVLWHILDTFHKTFFIFQ